MTHQIIIGGGPAATNAIESIRQFDGGASQITLISDEPAHSRMALPYWLSGQIPREQTQTGDSNYFERLGVETRFGDRVAAVDAGHCTIRTESGEQLSYDNLLIATGSSPVGLPVDGGDLPGVIPQWTTSHVQQARAILDEKPNARVVLVGAGFIGFIILSALHKRGCKLTVVEQASHVLPRMLTRSSAEFVHRWLGQKNVDVQVECSVTGIREANGAKVVTTTRGEIEADLVIVAVGVKPNVELASAAGLTTDHGILVDDHLRTSDPHIFAAGDCAQGVALFTDKAEVHAIQPTAVDHGRVAGANMASADVAYPGSLLMNVLDVCGLQCVSYGRWDDAEAEALEISSLKTNVYRNLLWSGDQITGATFVGQASNVGMLTDVGMVKGLMQTQTALGPWKEFLMQNPFDIRRAFIGTGVATKLAQTTLLGRPAASRGFHFGNAKPTVQATEHHAAYVGTKPS